MITDTKDRLIILKEYFKTRVYGSPLVNKDINAELLIKSLNIRNVHRIFVGKPNTLIVINDKMIVRMPLNRLSALRCRINNMMLKKLSKSSISHTVPRILGQGKIDQYSYYCEEKLPGFVIGFPANKMDELILKSVDFITRFHKDTKKNIVINEAIFNRLFIRDLDRLSAYLNEEHKEGLKKIKRYLREQLMNKEFKTVWMHGDYKIENILFDIKSWDMRGIIDWDLSRVEGIPLFDILYLLMYKETSLDCSVFSKRYFSMDFNEFERKIIDNYLLSFGISKELKKPIIILFCIHHIVQRYRQQLVAGTKKQYAWMSENVYNMINSIVTML